MKETSKDKTSWLIVIRHIVAGLLITPPLLILNNIWRAKQIEDPVLYILSLLIGLPIMLLPFVLAIALVITLLIFLFFTEKYKHNYKSLFLTVWWSVLSIVYFILISDIALPAMSATYDLALKSVEKPINLIHNKQEMERLKIGALLISGLVVLIFYFAFLSVLLETKSSQISYWRSLCCVLLMLPCSATCYILAFPSALYEFSGLQLFIASILGLTTSALLSPILVYVAVLIKNSLLGVKKALLNR